MRRGSVCALACNWLIPMLVLGSLLLALLPASVVAAETEVTFPDSNLEAAVRSAIAKPSGTLYQSDLDGLTSLDAHQRSIEDIRGLEYCSGLKDLDLNTNRISDLSPLSGLTSLTTLNLTFNRIADLSPLSGLTGLTWLHAYDNQIGDISPLSTLDNLQELFVGDNPISDISPLSSLTHLSKLSLMSITKGPHLSDISALSGMAGLAWLNLQGTGLRDISALADLANLTTLELSENEISDIRALAGLTQLDDLGLHTNQIADITALSGLTGLKYLSLPGNRIGDIAPLSGLTNLAELNIAVNRLSDVSAVSGLANLTVLHLGSNQISDISSLSGLTRLDWLGLDANRISDIGAIADNPGIGSGDYVSLTGNALNSISIDTYIPALLARGVEVSWDAPPSVITTPASAVAQTSATLNGSLTSPGSAPFVGVSFEWGLTTAYGSTTPAQTMDGAGTFSHPLGNLTPETYHFRAVAAGDVTVYGSDLTFVIGPPPVVSPTVVTGAASVLGPDSAMLNLNLTSLGSASSVQVSFQWGRGTSYGSTTTPQTMTGAGAYSYPLSGLSPAVTYHFRARADGDGTSYGTDLTFTTLPNPAAPPTVATAAATGVGSTSAILNLEVGSLGSASSVQVSVDYGQTSAYGSTSVPATMTGAGTFSFDITGLAAQTTYHCRAMAVGDGTGYGNDLTFTTLPELAMPPAVDTSDASGVPGGLVRLHGELAWLGTARSVTVSFVWGTAAGGPYPHQSAGSVLSAVGAFESDISELAPGTAFYYRARGVGEGIGYGVERAFTVPGREPTIGSLVVDHGRPGDAITVSVTGTNLDGATGLDFGTGIMVQEFVVVSNAEVTAMIAIDGQAEAGKRDVAVTTPWGTGSMAGGFEVKAGGDPVHLWVYLAAGAGGLVALGILGASLALLLRRRPER